MKFSMRFYALSKHKGQVDPIMSSQYYLSYKTVGSECKGTIKTSTTFRRKKIAQIRILQKAIASKKLLTSKK